MKLSLRIEEIGDAAARENFQRLEEAFKSLTFLKGKFRFVEISFLSAVTNFKFPHGLGFVPKDVLPTSITGAGAITWNYSLFDRTNLDITTTGACVVRAYVGSYREE